MEFSTRQEPVLRSARFRSPNAHERACGLWVDRIGWHRETPMPQPALRILGLYALVAVEEGEGLMVTGRHGRLPVAAGDVMIVLPDEPATYHPTGAGWCQRWVVWGGPAAAPLDRLCELAALGPVVHRAAAAVAQAYVQLRGRMADESLEAAVERDAVVRGLMAHLLASARRAGLSDAQCDALDRVLAFIQREHCSAPTLAALARHAGMSETHLRRLFVARMGMPPHAYITTQRIARAKALLAEGLRTREVADACGFSDVFYFMRVFKQVAGCTPGAWRQGGEGGGGNSPHDKMDPATKTARHSLALQNTAKQSAIRTGGRDCAEPRR